MNPALHHEQQKRYRQKHPLKTRESWIRNKYGITIDQYNRMLEAQGGTCYICKKPSVGKKPLAVDHDHKSGSVRKLLCMKCNLGLGSFDDDMELLGAAIKYLQEHKGDNETVVV